MSRGTASGEKILFSRKESAKLVGLSLRTFDAALAAGMLHGVRIGRRLLFRRDQLQAFARQNHPSPERTARASKIGNSR